jgi:hypothetical protein
LLGPLPPAQGNLKYVVVVVEYFSKWIEAGIPKALNASKTSFGSSTFGIIILKKVNNKDSKEYGKGQYKIKA